MNLTHDLMHFIISNNHLAILPRFYINGFECDLFVINKNLYTTEYEIKTCKSDYEKDFTKENKRTGQLYLPDKKHDVIKNGLRTNRFYFVLPSDLNVDVPEYAGLIEYCVKSNWYFFNIKKRAPFLHKNKTDVRMIKKCLTKLTWKYYNVERDLVYPERWKGSRI